MTKLASRVTCGALCLIAGSYLAFAQAPAAGQGPARERHASDLLRHQRRLPGGANLHGLAGADAHCADLAGATGDRTHTWHAYLSTQARGGQPQSTRATASAGPVVQRQWHDDAGCR
jgi:hypothetical protein